MEIVIAEKGAFYFEPIITAEEARGRASAHKVSAFGTLWHAKAHIRFSYDRSESYKVPVKTPHVASVSVGGSDYPLAAGAIEFPVVEHCERDERREIWLDGVTNQPVNAQPYMKARMNGVVLDDFVPEGAKLVSPVVRASAVIRTLLGDDLHPADADEVKEEQVNVECIDLHFRPTYNFKCTWTSKNKAAAVAVDAITGELQTQPHGAMAVVSKLLKPETLFDIGAETLNLVVPGGAIPLKVAKALVTKHKA
jgi:hypothetical protein